VILYATWLIGFFVAIRDAIADNTCAVTPFR
jgi:hypothetical protein